MENCKNCGGKYTYNPEFKALKCENCGTIEEVIVSRASEIPFEDALQKTVKNSWNRVAKSVKCERCGAVEVLDKGDLSDICPFCGGTNIIDVDEEEMLSPSAIMPFTITKKEAKYSFLSKIRKSIWAPKKLKRELKLKDPVGVYTPVYSFDADVLCSYSGTLYRQVSETIHSANGDTQLEYEEPFKVRGKTVLRADDILIDAGQNITSPILKRLEPFDSNNSVNFDDKFLYGYVANTGKKSITIAYKQAEDIFRNRLEDKIVNIYGAKRAGDIKMNLDVRNLTYKYILMPVYINGFTYKDKTYTLYCNGTTSKVAGKLPVSKGKVLSLVLSLVGVCIGAILLAILI